MERSLQEIMELDFPPRPPSTPETLDLNYPHTDGTGFPNSRTQLRNSNQQMPIHDTFQHSPYFLPTNYNFTMERFSEENMELEYPPRPPSTPETVDLNPPSPLPRQQPPIPDLFIPENPPAMLNHPRYIDCMGFPNSRTMPRNANEQMPIDHTFANYVHFHPTNMEPEPQYYYVEPEPLLQYVESEWDFPSPFDVEQLFNSEAEYRIQFQSESLFFDLEPEHNIPVQSETQLFNLEPEFNIPSQSEPPLLDLEPVYNIPLQLDQPLLTLGPENNPFQPGTPFFDFFNVEPPLYDLEPI